MLRLGSLISVLAFLSLVPRAAGWTPGEAVLEQAMGGREGAVVWIDLDSGREVTLGGLRVETPVPPASTIKLLSAYLFLTRGIVRPEEEVLCRKFLFGGRSYQCWKPGGHGWIDLAGALRESCNGFFYRRGLIVPPSELIDLATRWGFTREPPGHEPFDDPQGAFAHAGRLLVSPRTQARLLAQLGATLRGARAPAGRDRPYADREAVEAMVPGMLACGRTGSGRKAALKGYDFLARTGSYRGTGWYLSLFPHPSPRVALAVMVAPGNARRAAPVVRQLMSLHRDSTLPVETTSMSTR